MVKTLRRVALIALGFAVAITITALAPANPAGWQVTDHARISDLSAAEKDALLSSHYGLPREALSDDPAAVTHWWSSLSRAEHRRLVARMPDILGNLAGVDYFSRDRANRTQLVRDLHDAEHQLELRPQDEDAARQLAALQAITGALDVSPDRRLVQLTSDSPPLAAIAIGDLNRATHITFVVPGMGTLTTDMQLWTRAAQNVLDAQASAGPARGLAVIAWVGYVTPPVGLEATRDNYSSRGALLLARDIQGLHAARHSHPPTIDIVAHSYGATTAACALATADLGVDTLVMLGSAGVDSDIANAARLHVNRVYAAEAVADHQAQWGRVDRTDPRIASFGASWLGVNGGDGLLPVTGHEPIIHSDWNDDPASAAWTRYTDNDVRSSLYAIHMKSFGYLDLGTQSLHSVGQVTAVPVGRIRMASWELRGHRAGSREPIVAQAEPATTYWLG